MKGITPIDESVGANPHPGPPPCTGEGTFRADTRGGKRERGFYFQRRYRGHRVQIRLFS
jgi:hypothetical protein